MAEEDLPRIAAWLLPPHVARSRKRRWPRAGAKPGSTTRSAIPRGSGAGQAQLISVLVAEIGRHHPGAGVLVGPDAANTASRRVLEKNGFELVAVRPVATEPGDAPIAIYRLPAVPAC